MENTNLLGPSFELNSNFSLSTSSSAARGHFAVNNGGQRVFTRYTSDPGLTQSSSSSPPSSPCSLTAIDSSPPSSPALAAVAEDDIDLDTEMDLEDTTFKLNLDRAKVRCITPELEGHAQNREENTGTRKSGGNMVVLQTSPAHPFSASTRGVKRPPMYDKSASRAKIRRKNLSFESAGSDETSPGSSQGSGANAYQRPLPMPVFGLGHPLGFDPFAALDRPNNVYTRDAYLHDDSHVDHGLELEFGSARRSFNPELALWEETIAQAVDGAESKIDLSGHNLSFISPSISDLASIVVFSGQNEASSPRGSEKSPQKRTMSRSTTSQVFGSSKVGTQEDEIHLFLGNNRISFLPHELFNIDALVVLSLRHNQLTEIPPLISQLRNLRELNVSNNRLKYLPSEILSMKLTSLAVDPNPFIVNPNSISESGKERWVGPVERIHRIMPLAELAIRVLIAPVEEDVLHSHSISEKINWRRTYKSRLEELYDFPIQELPASIDALLAHCLPGSVPAQRRGADPSASPLTTPMTACSSTSRDKRSRSRPCISECTSPLHRLLRPGEAYQRPLFVEHAEERMSWEKEVAGQKVGGEHGVPVLWRGCSAGCLDYLDLAKDTGNGSPSDDRGNVAVAPEEEAWDVSVPAADEGPTPVPMVLQLPSEDPPPFSSEGFEFDDD